MSPVARRRPRRRPVLPDGAPSSSTSLRTLVYRLRVLGDAIAYRAAVTRQSLVVVGVGLAVVLLATIVTVLVAPFADRVGAWVGPQLASRMANWALGLFLRFAPISTEDASRVMAAQVADLADVSADGGHDSASLDSASDRDPTP